MGIHICGAPCCWGVDDITNPHLPTWQRVLREAHEAGYSAIELGPNGWIPTDDIEGVTAELNKNQLSIVAGTIFDDVLRWTAFASSSPSCRRCRGKMVSAGRHRT